MSDIYDALMGGTPVNPVWSDSNIKSDWAEPAVTASPDLSSIELANQAVTLSERALDQIRRLETQLKDNEAQRQFLMVELSRAQNLRERLSCRDRVGSTGGVVSRVTAVEAAMDRRP